MDLLLDKPLTLQGEPLATNRFLVHFGEKRGIFYEWHVSKIENMPIDFDKKENNNIIVITFNQHEKWGDAKFIEQCELFNALKNRDIFNEYLDQTGCTVCKEKYCGCFITKIEFTPCDYKINKQKQCKITIKYDYFRTN